MPEPYGQLPPPPDPDAIDQEAGRAFDLLPESLRGCAPVVAIGVLLLILVLIALGFSQNWFEDDPPPGTSSSTSPSTSQSSSESASPSPGESPGESPSEFPSESPSQPETGGTYTPPAEEDLPAGAVLYTGSSGGQIGCITCDGASRFLSIERPGVGVGDLARPEQEVVWKANGQFVEFGANLSGPNKGRYGYNLFANGTTYMAGCAMEIGQTSCQQQRPNDVAAGDRITIIIGEGGTMVNGQVASRGDFTVDWWFVFRPPPDQRRRRADLSTTIGVRNPSRFAGWP